MAGEFRVEVAMGNMRYFLRGEECRMLSDALESGALGESGVCARVRDDLRKALDRAAGTGRDGVPMQDGGRETTDAGDDGAARCAWCGESGAELPMRPGDTEALYVCRAEGCQRRDKPATRAFFTTGYR